MKHQLLVVIGAALLSFGGIGIIVGLTWLIVRQVHSALPNILDNSAATLLYLVPAVLLGIAVVGAAFVAAALSAPTHEERAFRRLHPHTRFHA